MEGVEADDYPSTSALVSLLRHLDKKLIRTLNDVPADYEGFEIVDHRREVDAKWSRYSIGVKIREDDLLGWAVHAWIRSQQRGASRGPNYLRHRLWGSRPSPPRSSPTARPSLRAWEAVIQPPRLSEPCI